MKLLETSIKEVIQETKDTITAVLADPLDYKAGQFITLVTEWNGERLYRSYSFSSAPEVDLLPTITIKRVAKGKVSNYLNDHLKSNDVIQFIKPSGGFTLQQSDQDTNIFFAGGSGITPLFSLIKELLYTEQKKRILLVYTNRYWQDIIFLEQLKKLTETYKKRFQIIHNLTQEHLENETYQGRLDYKKIQDILYQYEKSAYKDADYYLCGPFGMMQLIKESLIQLNVKAQNIYTESFEVIEPNKFSEKEPIENSTFVELSYEGMNHIVEVPKNTTILEAALDQGIDLPFACQAGTCNVCIAKCTSGEVYMETEEGLEEEEKQEGCILTCVAYPKSNDVKLIIEEVY